MERKEKQKRKNWLMEKVKLTPLMETVEPLKCQKKREKLMIKLIPLMIPVNDQIIDEDKNKFEPFLPGMTEISDIEIVDDRIGNSRMEKPQKPKTITPVYRPINNTPVVPEANSTQIISDVGHTYAYVNSEYIEMGNFLIRIIEETRKITEIINAENQVENQSEQLFWKVEIQSKNRRYFGEIENKKIFSISSWIREVTEGRCFIEKGSGQLWDKHIQVQIEEEKFQRVTIYESPGWKKHEKNWMFVTSEGVVGHPELPIFSKKGFSFIKGYRKKSKYELINEFLRMRKIIAKKPENAVVLQYFSMMAVLTRIFQETDCPIKFSVAVVGKTNSRKTSSALIFTRLYNRKKGMVPEINFTSTEVAIYEAMAKYADAVLMVDDLTPPENAANAKEQMKKAELIVRSYGDRVPRRRSKVYAKDKGVDEFSPILGVCLVTGEIWGGCKSSQSRVIRLEFDDDDVDNNVLLHYQQNLSDYSDFMYIFIEYIEKNMDAVQQIIQRNFEKGRLSSAKSTGLSTARFREALGQFAANAEIFRNFLVSTGYCSFEHAEEMRASDIEIINNVLQKNDGFVQTLAPGILLIRALHEAIISGDVELKKREDLTDLMSQEISLQNTVLYSDNFYYVTADTLWKIADNYAKAHHFFFPYHDGKEIVSLLKNENLLYTKKEGNSIRSSLHIGIGKNFRCLHIFRDKAEAIWAEEAVL